MNPGVQAVLRGSGALFLLAGCYAGLPASDATTIANGDASSAGDATAPSTTATSATGATGATTTANPTSMTSTPTTGETASDPSDASNDTANDVDPDTGISDGTTEDTGEGTSGGPLVCDPTEMLDVPDDTWTWVPFPETSCAYDGTAGIFVNPSPRTRNLMIYLQGGGACFHENDCESSQLDGIDDALVIADMGGRPQLDRTVVTNPFADYDYVFVPYCTGDFHTGDNVSSYGANHVGHANLMAYLDRIVPTFCDAERLVVVGSSAGGFGATFNFPYIREAFADIPADLIDDSGPFLDPDWMPLAFQDMIDVNWGFQANYPADCVECGDGWHGLYSYISAKYPETNLSLISALYDPSIQSRFEPYTPLANTTMFRTGLEALVDTHLAVLPNMRVFLVDEGFHVYLWSALDLVISDGQTLEEFFRDQLDHDAGWASARP